MMAKEMFEELGYLYKEHKNKITIISCDEYDDLKIIFEFEFKIKRIGVKSYHISVKELKAIQQQIKELGWLDE